MKRAGSMRGCAAVAATVGITVLIVGGACGAGASCPLVGATGGAAGHGDGAGGARAACSTEGDIVPAAERVSNGNPVLPPKWAFGVLFGSYYDQAPGPSSPGDIIDAMTRLRADYSGDLMWIDSSWLSSTYQGDTGARYICFQFDPVTFPDPAAMIATMQANHFHFGVWEWPWVDQGCPLFAYGAANHLFVEANGTVLNAGGWHGNTFTGAFDYRKDAAVAWWTEDNQQLVDWGLDFMKLDTAGQPPDGIDTDNYRARYHRAAYDATARRGAVTNAAIAANGGRGFILAHAYESTANDQTPGMWTGDSEATWSGMQAEMAIAAGLNKSTLAAYWGGDTGGYVGTPTDELFVRWLQYSAFTPLQEFFGSKDRSTGSRFPWTFSTEAQRLFQQYTQLRYRLLPFRYSNALATYVESPVRYPVRWIGTQQFVLGNDASQLLVQPVTTEGATTATVTLPDGPGWIHYWTGEAYPGGATVSVPAPLAQIPLFVRAGAILAMGPPLRWVDELPADPLTLDIYPAGATSTTLYEDDGASQAYMAGAYASTRISCDDSGGRPVITIGPQRVAKYSYAGRLCWRTYLLKVNQQTTAPAAVMRDGAPLPPMPSQADLDAAAEGWFYDPVSLTVWVKLGLASDDGTAVSL